MPAHFDEQPIFFYDLGSPACYLIAEQVNAQLPVVPEWEPLPGGEFEAWPVEPGEVVRLARELALQPVRWPHRWPPDTAEATRAATYAKHIGRAVAFSLACFRQAFAGGRDLGERDTVLIAAAACEMHPSAVLKGQGLRSVRDGMTRAVMRAREAGVTSLPAIVVGAQVFEGIDALAQASRVYGVRT